MIEQLCVLYPRKEPRNASQQQPFLLRVQQPIRLMFKLLPKL